MRRRISVERHFYTKQRLVDKLSTNGPRQMALMMFMYKISFFRPVTLEGVFLLFHSGLLLRKLKGASKKEIRSFMQHFIIGFAKL